MVVSGSRAMAGPLTGVFLGLWAVGDPQKSRWRGGWLAGFCPLISRLLVGKRRKRAEEVGLPGAETRY
jgi:hypothetical protein